MAKRKTPSAWTEAAKTTRLRAGDKITNEHARIIKKATRDTITHFKKYGCDLDFNTVLEGLSDSLLGFCPETLLMEQLCHKLPNIRLSLTKGTRLVLRNPKRGSK